MKGGTLWRQKKNPEKKSHGAEKKSKGDPLGTSGCVCFLEKVKNEKGTLWTESPLAGLSLRCSGGFRIVSKKWTDQCEDCSLKKKNSHCYSRAFFLKRIERRIKTRRELLKSALYLSSKSAKFLKHAQDVFMKSSENSFETPKGCLSCSIRLGKHLFSNWEQKKHF